MLEILYFFLKVILMYIIYKVNFYEELLQKNEMWYIINLYSLKEFNYAENGVRDTLDIQEKYKKGEFGAIPEPNLISTLLEVDNKEI